MPTEQGQHNNADDLEWYEEEPILCQCSICPFHTYIWDEFKEHWQCEVEKQARKETEDSSPSTSKGSSECNEQKMEQFEQLKRFQCSLMWLSRQLNLSEYSSLLRVCKQNGRREGQIRPYVCSVCEY
uniref:Uncharacterized protein n=1 Tax=Echinococcus canadensis TaxID=519352 RepID=A0A915F0J2_9CEST